MARRAEELARAYPVHVFDCDGVLLASNEAKGRGFFSAAAPEYGEAAAGLLEAYHHRAGNLTRRERLEAFFTEVLRRSPAAGELEGLLERCDEAIRAAVMAAPLVPGVEAYLDVLEATGVELVVVSGTESEELHAVLEAHGLARRFARVLGGPTPKVEHLRAVMPPWPAVYYGDAADDGRACAEAGVDWCCVRGYSADPGVEAMLLRGTAAHVIDDFSELVRDERDETGRASAPVAMGGTPSPSAASRPPDQYVRVRLDREGYGLVAGRRVYVSRSLAGATVRVRRETS